MHFEYKGHSVEISPSVFLNRNQIIVNGEVWATPIIRKDEDTEALAKHIIDSSI